MTVDRAVRLMAGVMVLASLALARWVSPNWLWLTCVCRAEFVAVRVYQLVPGDDVLSQDGSAGTQQGDAVSQLSNGTN